MALLPLCSEGMDDEDEGGGPVGVRSAMDAEVRGALFPGAHDV